MRYDIRHFGEVLAQNIIFYGGFSKDWGNQTSYATEMDLFLVTAATICTDGVLGGRWLCCFNEGIVLLLWMDKKRKTFRALLNFAFVSNLSCRAYIYPPWLPSRTTTGLYMPMVKIDIFSLAIAAIFVGKHWANCNWNGSMFWLEFSKTEEMRNDMRYWALNSTTSGYSR